MKKLSVILLAAMLIAALAVPTYALSPPWVEYASEIKALFGEDPDVAIEYNDDEREVVLLVEDQVKADAIAELLGEEKTFGNVVLKITVIPANNASEPTRAELIARAFNGNPIVKDMVSVRGLFDMNYVVFENKVVQFWNDDMGDLNGLKSTLYQDIALDVLGGDGGMFYCTEPGDPALKIPLGEWP